MPSPSNRAVIAAAGSGKTEYIIGRALEAPTFQRVLITTYTTRNCDQIFGRIQTANGCTLPHVSVQGWFSFLINQAARPYQSSVTGQIDFAKLKAACIRIAGRASDQMPCESGDHCASDPEPPSIPQIFFLARQSASHLARAGDVG